MSAGWKFWTLVLGGCAVAVVVIALSIAAMVTSI